MAREMRRLQERLGRAVTVAALQPRLEVQSKRPPLRLGASRTMCDIVGSFCFLTAARTKQRRLMSTIAFNSFRIKEFVVPSDFANVRAACNS